MSTKTFSHKATLLLATSPIALAVGCGSGGVLPPFISPNGGTFNSAQKVTLWEPVNGTTIYYTTDGTAPTTASERYTGPITVAATEEVEAMAVTGDGLQSVVSTADFLINEPITPPPQPPAPPPPQSIGCGSMKDGSFNDLSYGDKLLVVTQNNSLITAQKQTNDTLSCYFDPDAQVVADPSDPALPAGKYIAIHKDVNGNEDSIWEFEKTPDTDLGTGYFYVDGRGIGISNDLQTDQRIATIYYYGLSLNNQCVSNYYGWHFNANFYHLTQPGSATNYKLAADANISNYMPVINEEFTPAVLAIDGIYYGCTQNEYTPQLQAIKKALDHSFDMNVSSWDLNSYAIDNFSSAGTRFIITFDPNYPVNPNLPYKLYIRSDESMKATDDSFEGLVLDLWFGTKTSAFEGQINGVHLLTRDVNGNEQPIAGPQATGWYNQIMSYLKHTANIPDIIKSSTSMSSRQSAGATNGQVIQLLQSPGGQTAGVLRPDKIIHVGPSL